MCDAVGLRPVVSSLAPTGTRRLWISRIHRQRSKGPSAEPHRSKLTPIFAAFVQSAWNDDAGEFRNFMGFARNWLEDAGSEDSCGRTIWALGATALEGQTPGLRRWARGLFDRTAASATGQSADFTE